AYRLAHVPVFSELQVARQTVADHRRVRRHHALNKAADVLAGAVSQRLQPHPPRVTVRGEFYRANDQQLADIRDAITLDRVVLRAQRHFGLVRLHHGLQQTALRRYHRPAQLVQQQPSRLVAADAELRLRLLGGDAVRMARQLVDRREPRPQRQLAAMHHRTGGHRGLPVAAATLPGERLGLELPALTDAAGRTDETLRPPLRGEVAGARRPVRKPSVELRPRHRPIGFPSAACHQNIMATFGRLSTDSGRPSYYHWGRRSQREEPYFPGFSHEELIAENENERRRLIENGVPAWFAERAYSTPNNSMWWPSSDILKQANIVTAVARSSDFALSGAPRELDRDKFEAGLLEVPA